MSKRKSTKTNATRGSPLLKLARTKVNSLVQKRVAFVHGTKRDYFLFNDQPFFSFPQIIGKDYLHSTTVTSEKFSGGFYVACYDIDLRPG